MFVILLLFSQILGPKSRIYAAVRALFLLYGDTVLKVF